MAKIARSERIMVRLTPEEKIFIDKKTKELKTSASDLARGLILDYKAVDESLGDCEVNKNGWN